MKNLAVVLFILLIVVAWMGAHRTHEGDTRLPSAPSAQLVPAPKPATELPTRLPQPRPHEPLQMAGPSAGLPPAVSYPPPDDQLVEAQPGTAPLTPEEQKAVYESMHSAQPSDEETDDW